MKFSSTAIALCALFTVFCSSATEVTEHTLTIKDMVSAKNLIDHVNAMTRYLDVVLKPINGNGSPVECKISTDDLIKGLNLALQKNKNIDSNAQITASITIKNDWKLTGLTRYTALYTCSLKDALYATYTYDRQDRSSLYSKKERVLGGVAAGVGVSIFACFFALVVIGPWYAISQLRIRF